MPSKGRRKKAPTMAQHADRHKLYQQAVPCVESEIELMGPLA